MTTQNILLAVLLVNLWTMLLFGVDKVLAEKSGSRISEATLLFWALVGGSIGAYAGRAIFRHKTRKQPFSTTLHMIAVLQTICGAGGLIWRVL